MNTKVVSVILAALATGASTQAYVLIGATPHTVTFLPGPGTYEYKYSLLMSDAEFAFALNPFNADFALWDIHGLVTAGLGAPSVSAAGFSVTTGSVTPPATAQVIDDPLLADIRVSFVGAPPGPQDPFGPGDTILGDLVFQSIYGPVVFNDGNNFQSLTLQYVSAPTVPGNVEINTLTALVPMPIPEAGTVAAGAALAALGAGYLFRRQRKA